MSYDHENLAKLKDIIETRRRMKKRKEKRCTKMQGSDVDDIYQQETDYEFSPERKSSISAEYEKETECDLTAESEIGSDMESQYGRETQSDFTQDKSIYFTQTEYELSSPLQGNRKHTADRNLQKKGKTSQSDSDEESSVEPRSLTEEELASSGYEVVTPTDNDGVEEEAKSIGKDREKSNGVYDDSKMDTKAFGMHIDSSEDSYDDSKADSPEVSENGENSDESSDKSDNQVEVEYNEHSEDDHEKGKEKVKTESGENKQSTNDSDDNRSENQLVGEHSKHSGDDNEDRKSEKQSVSEQSKQSEDDSDHNKSNIQADAEHSEVSEDARGDYKSENQPVSEHSEEDANEDNKTDTHPISEHSEGSENDTSDTKTDTKADDKHSEQSDDDLDDNKRNTQSVSEHSESSEDHDGNDKIDTRPEDEDSERSDDYENIKKDVKAEHSEQLDDDYYDNKKDTQSLSEHSKKSEIDNDNHITDTHPRGKPSERSDDDYEDYPVGEHSEMSEEDNDENISKARTFGEQCEEHADDSDGSKSEYQTRFKYGEKSTDTSDYRKKETLGKCEISIDENGDYKRRTSPESDHMEQSTSDQSESDEPDIKTYPKVFKIHISAEEFDEMRPSHNQEKTKKKLQFLKGWTHILAEKFSSVNPACVLKFRYHKVQEKKENSLTGACYFFTKAECKHKNCGKWTMKIEEKPKRGRPVSITVVQTKSVVRHQRGMHLKRQLSGKIRKKAQARLQKETAGSVYWSEYSKMPKAELQAENFTKCQSESVLRKAKSEIRTGDILHPEPFTELVILKEVFDEDEPYIQELSYTPFMTVLYSADSINVAKHSITKGSGVFYLDATGQVIKTLHQKRVLYYCIIIKEKKLPIVPILEFLSDHHATQFITRPLLSFRVALGQKILPRRIEVDFSWAVIHSVLIAFNNMTIHTYLNLCHQICAHQGDSHFVVIHVCCIHVLRALRVTVKEKVKDKNLREIVLRMMAILQNTTTLQQALNVWKIFCTVLNNRKRTQAVAKAIRSMNRMLEDASSKSLESEENYVCSEDQGESGLIDKDQKEKLGIRDRSPFRPVFLQYLVEEEEESEQEDNVYFHKEIIRHIGQHYMPLYPLWSGCMLEEGKTRDSNAPVEGWMKVVKKDTLMGERNLRAGQFIRKLRPIVGGRLRKVKLMQGLHSTRKKERKRKIIKEDIDEAEEGWSKKAKGKERTSFLYSPAETLPVPKTKKKMPPKKSQSLGKEVKKMKEKNPSGLTNKGNSCWLNSTLQAVAAMKQLNCEGIDRISIEAQRVIEKLRIIGEEDSNIDPEELRESAWRDLSYMKGQQQDGAEFIQSLMHRSNHQLMHLLHTRICQVCKRVSKTEEVSNVVSVELASVRPTSVKDCLTEFGKVEILTGEDAPFCHVCNTNTNHSTQTAITEAEVLIISLKRFRMSKAGRHLKESRSIRVNRVLGWKDVGVYRLRAIQCHLGSSMERGHYITVTVDDEWQNRRCDDSRVTYAHPLSLDGKEVKESSYVLYYEKLSQQDAFTLIRNLPDVPLAFYGGIDLMGLDLSTLLPGEKMNDQVINAYMYIICKTYSHAAALDVFFSTSLVLKREPRKFVKEEIFLRQIVLVPFIHREHWTLLVIRPANHTISVYDSANGGDEPANLLVQYMLEEDGVQYRVRNIQNLPKQKNNKDYGAFMCQFALHVASHKKIGFTHMNIGYLRKKMLFECLASTLL